MQSIFRKLVFGKNEERKLPGSADKPPKPSPHLPEEARFRILIAGPGYAGKSNIFSRYFDAQFHLITTVTIGVDTKTKTTQEKNKENRLVTIKQQIWDLPGLESVKAITKSYFNGADLVIFVFSLTDRGSFEKLATLFKEYKGLAKDAKFLLVGNKSDEKEKREISFLEGRDFADENEIETYIETSAKTGENIEEVFHQGSLLLLKDKGWL